VTARFGGLRDYVEAVHALGLEWPLMDGNHTLANGNRDFHPYTTMSYQSGHADVWSGESFPRFPCVYWVAVPQALRARRPNRLLHLPPQAQGLHPLTREPAAPWRAPHNGGQPERGRGRPRRGAGQPDEAAEGRRRVSGGPPACVVCVVRVVPPAHTHTRACVRACVVWHARATVFCPRALVWVRVEIMGSIIIRTD
jgi:hypothetical protein